MARKLSKAEQERARTDFDRPDQEQPIKEEAKDPQEKKRGGRPPSLTPRTGNLHIRLSDADREKLEEAALITGKTKTVVIVEGIDYIYSKAIAEKRRKEAKE